MCENCFENQKYQFPSQSDFDQLDLELSKKLGKDYLRFVENVTMGYGSFGYNVYECNTCSTKWCLSDPDHSWRGFFLTGENVNKHIDSITKSNRSKIIGWVTLLVIIILIIFVIWIK